MNLLWEHCEEPYYGQEEYTKKYTDYEQLITYKDNEYYADVTYTVKIVELNGKYTIEDCKIESYVLSDENGEVNLPKEDVLPLLPSMSEEAKAEVLREVMKNA